MYTLLLYAACTSYRSLEDPLEPLLLQGKAGPWYLSHASDHYHNRGSRILSPSDLCTDIPYTSRLQCRLPTGSTDQQWLSRDDTSGRQWTQSWCMSVLLESILAGLNRLGGAIAYRCVMAECVLVVDGRPIFGFLGRSPLNALLK